MGATRLGRRSLPDFESHLESGLIAVRLALKFPDWVTRRVEQAVYLDDTTVRWRVSVTFRFPEPDFFEGTVKISAGQKIYVPLVLLRKTPLTDFDARGEDGRALPVLASKRNSQVSEDGMIKIVWSLAESVGRQGLSDSTVQLIRTVVSSSPDRAEPMLRDALSAGELAEVLAEENEYRALMHDLATSFMLLTPCWYEPGRERVIKYAYAAPLPWRRNPRNFAAIFGWADFLSKLDGLGLGSAGSYHIEVEAPSDVLLASARVIGLYMDRERDVRVPLRLDRDGDNPRVNLHAVRPSERRWKFARATAKYRKIHFWKRWCVEKPKLGPEPQDRVKAAQEARPTRVERDDQGYAQVWFRNEIAGVFAAAVAISVLTCLLLWGVRSRLVDVDGQTGAAILLALPVLAAGYLIRPGEHAFATRLLAGVRALTLIVSVCALLVAGLLAAGLTRRVAPKFPSYRCTSTARPRDHKTSGPLFGSATCTSARLSAAAPSLKPHIQTLANWSAYVATFAVGILLIGLLRTAIAPCRPRSGAD